MHDVRGDHGTRKPGPGTGPRGGGSGGNPRGLYREHAAGPGVGPGVGPGSGLTSPRGAAGPGSTLSLPRAGQHSAHSRAHAHRFLLPQSGVFIGIETVIEIDIDRPFAPSFFARNRESPAQPT
jgi:hypothetical protein